MVYTPELSVLASPSHVGDQGSVIEIARWVNIGCTLWLKSVALRKVELKSMGKKELVTLL